MDNNQEELITREQAASRLNVSMRKIDEMIKVGELREVRLGRRCRRVDVQSLSHFLGRAPDTQDRT